jgi:uncharacterized protein (TIGR02145 family)
MATIRKIKPKSPDPYIGKTKGDNEFARLAHLNNLVDQINSADFGTGSSSGIAVNSSTDIGKLVFDSTQFTSIPDLFTTPAEMTISMVGPKVYRARLYQATEQWSGYAMLYNGWAVIDPRGLADPAGGSGQSGAYVWRVPNNAFNSDFTDLFNTIGGFDKAYKLKSTVKTSNTNLGWNTTYSGFTTATDEFNFSMVPGGRRNGQGNYGSITISNSFWTAETYFSGNILRAYISLSDSDNLNGNLQNMELGLSVRLVRNATPSELSLPDGATSDDSSLPPYISSNNIYNIITYKTVKIGNRIWLAQNLRENRFNNGDSILNLAGAGAGGDPSNSAWINANATNTPALTEYLIEPQMASTGYYLPSVVSSFNNIVLENTIGTEIIWSSNDTLAYTRYLAKKYDSSSWYPTHINITSSCAPGNLFLGDFTEIGMIVINNGVGDFDGTDTIAFVPYKRTPSGVLTISNFDNDNPNFSGVYVEILEYQPTATPYYLGFGDGVGVNNI